MDARRSGRDGRSDFSVEADIGMRCHNSKGSTEPTDFRKTAAAVGGNRTRLFYLQVLHLRTGDDRRRRAEEIRNF